MIDCSRWVAGLVLAKQGQFKMGRGGAGIYLQSFFISINRPLIVHLPRELLPHQKMRLSLLLYLAVPAGITAAHAQAKQNATGATPRQTRLNHAAKLNEPAITSNDALSPAFLRKPAGLC